MPIWKPFMAWMAAWALAGLSKLTKPEVRVHNAGPPHLTLLCSLVPHPTLLLLRPPNARKAAQHTAGPQLAVLDGWVA